MRITMLFLLVLALAGCDRHEDDAQPLPVSVQTVDGSAASGGTRYSASVRPGVQVDLAFKVGGYVDGLYEVRGVDGRMRPVQDGDFVRRGTVLARVGDRERSDALSQARAGATQAKADFDRATQLYENRSVSKADYDAAYARWEASRAQEDQAAQGLADCSLRSPLDGVVLRRSIEVGTLVSAGMPAISVADLRTVEVVFGVPDVQIGAMKAGSSQDVHVEAVPGRAFQGLITRVAPSADPSSRVFEVEVTLPNTDGRLKAGMVAWLEVAGSARVSLVTVPLNAVVRPPGETTGYAVFVVDHAAQGDVARLRRVTLGGIHEDRIEVVEGLRGGEQVIVRGATLAVDAHAVRIVP